MKNYAIIEDGEFVGFINDQVFSSIPDSAVEVSDEAYADFLANQGYRKWDSDAHTFVEFTPTGPTNEDLWAALRIERDRRLDATDKAVRRHEDQKTLGVATTISEQQFTDLLTYRQALRDLPENTVDPESPVWPVDPLV